MPKDEQLKTTIVGYRPPRYPGEPKARRAIIRLDSDITLRNQPKEQ